MVVLIKLTRPNGDTIYFNANQIYWVAKAENGGSEILDVEGDRFNVKETPEIIDARIDKQIKNMRSEY